MQCWGHVVQCWGHMGQCWGHVDQYRGHMAQSAYSDRRCCSSPRLSGSRLSLLFVKRLWMSGELGGAAEWAEKQVRRQQGREGGSR